MLWLSLILFLFYKEPEVFLRIGLNFANASHLQVRSFLSLKMIIYNLLISLYQEIMNLLYLRVLHAFCHLLESCQKILYYILVIIVFHFRKVLLILLQFIMLYVHQFFLVNFIISLL